ncbi:MAG: FliM/FliN family flagellar motor switch protein [Candidatus Margulisbacteria bacterium]|jgi:flagellar motor switch protein FliM|nr:FliM/FliN family flagellar motor switch protein [Candidatus Margulisiibacteriota bacterium]
MATLVKDIRLRPVIGKWYEYRPGRDYTNDFATANLEKEQIDELLELHHKWGESFGALINQNLKIACGTQETAVLKLKYSDLQNRLPNATTSFEVSSAVDFTAALDNVLAYAFLDRACGGPGIAVKKLNEALTVIEKSALQPLWQEMLKSYQTQLLGVLGDCAAGEVFAPRIKPETKLKKDDEVLVFSNSFYLADNKPAEVLFVYAEKAVEKLTELYSAQKAAKPKKLTLRLSPDAITNVKVPVNVRIGSTAVTINDILNLQPGDVFQLKEKVSESLVLSIAEQGEFFVQLGRKAEKYAVKVVEHKPKFYNFAAPAAPAPAVRPLEAPLAEPEIPTVEVKDPVQLKSARPAAAPPENPPAPPVVNEQSVAYTPEGKVDEEKLEIKDPLLDELLPEDKAAEDGDDFTWDIDDLK